MHLATSSFIIKYCKLVGSVLLLCVHVVQSFRIHRSLDCCRVTDFSMKIEGVLLPCALSLHIILLSVTYQNFRYEIEIWKITRSVFIQV